MTNAVIPDLRDLLSKFDNSPIPKKKGSLENLENPAAPRVPIPVSITSSTAQGGGGSFKDSKPIGGWLL